MNYPRLLGFVAAILAASQAGAGTIDIEALRNLRDEARAYEDLSAEQYRKILKEKKHPLQALRTKLLQFLDSSAISTPRPEEADELSRAMESHVIQQLALELVAATFEWVDRHYPDAEGKAQNSYRYEVQLSKLNQYRSVIREATEAASAGKPYSPDLIKLKPDGFPPAEIPLPGGCDRVIKSLRLLANVAPLRPIGEIGIERQESELLISHFYHAYRSNALPCSVTVGMHAPDAVEMILGRRRIQFDQQFAFLVREQKSYRAFDGKRIQLEIIWTSLQDTEKRWNSVKILRSWSKRWDGLLKAPLREMESP